MCIHYNNHSQIKPKIHIGGYNYEQINDRYIICSSIDISINRHKLFNSISNILNKIEHVHIFCWHDFHSIFQTEEFKNIPYTIHNVIYDDLEYTYDMAKKLQPIVKTLTIIEEPNIRTYKIPVYDNYHDILYPSYEQQLFLEKKFGNIHMNIEEIKSYVFPKSTYIPSKDFVPFDWKKCQEGIYPKIVPILGRN